MPIQLTHENAARISLVQRTINAQIKYGPRSGEVRPASISGRIPDE